MPSPSDKELQDRYLEFLTNQINEMNGVEPEVDEESLSL